MEKTFKYDVAGHLFEVILPDGISADDFLGPYIPFSSGREDEPLFRLRLEYSADLKNTVPGNVRECLNDEAPYFWIFDKDGKFNFGFSYTRSHPDCILIPSDDFRENVVYVPAARKERLTEFSLSNALMLLYTFCTTPFDTLMVHASVIKHNGGGYMFLGRSGTGKSTHSRLWLENIDDTELLNDDNPVIRVTDGEAVIYGTPWSGKTPCYKNKEAELGAFVQLKQAPQNTFSFLKGIQAYMVLLAGSSSLKWNTEAYNALGKTIERLANRIPVGYLECLPDEEAARICYMNINK